MFIIVIIILIYRLYKHIDCVNLLGSLQRRDVFDVRYEH
jgi:hypothetical protein